MARGIGENQFETLLRENVYLAPLTTLRVGGPARFFADVQSTDQLLAGVRWAVSRSLPVFVLGGGSNIVVSDRGVPGLVLRNAIFGIEVQAGSGDSTMVTAGAGVQWDDVVRLAVANNLAGVECLSGIPGSVGATPIQNVGAYGQEISETMVQLTALDMAAGSTVVIDSNECRFGYRTSRFKASDNGRFIITSVTYRLRQNGDPAIRYPDLKHHIEERGSRKAGLAEVRDAVLAIRRAKAMVIDPSDPDTRSVGSFFVNPIVPLDTLAEIERKLSATSRTPPIPSFPAPGGLVKLSAAWLIEQSGFARGYEYGRVGISSKHTLAIVARQGGTAREIMELASRIQERVWAQFSIQLAPEPSFIGLK